ncbi:hypothetical protein OF83DRAFT_913172 [Amylostereum chailletii]|nr:hypothetical protein OF83DRAFT_913172 [Amylostereum chailletii]
MKVKHSRKSKRAGNDEANKDSKAIKDKKTRKDKELPSLPFVDSPELESTPRQTSRISPPVTAPWSKANGKRVSAPLSTNKYIPAPFSCRMWAPRRLRATLEEEARVIEITRRAAANEAKKESDAANQAKEEPDAANQAKEESDERTPEPSTPVKESGTSTSSSNSSSTSPATPEMPMTPISAKSTIPFSELFFPYTYPPDLEDHARRLVPSVPFPFSSSIAIQQAVADVQPVVATDKLANEPKIPAAPSLFAQDHLEKSKLMPYQAAIDDVYMHVPLSSSWTDCPRTKYKHIGLNIDTAVRQHLRQQVYQKYIPVIHSAMDMMETEWMAEVFASEVGKIRPVEEHIRW